MKKLLILSLLFFSTSAFAQPNTKICYINANGGCTPVGTSNPLPITGTISTTVTFPTIGAAVPATGIYNGVNVAGTLRGWSGISTGSIFPGAVAIVDASGNQITSFGSSAAVGATGAAVPASASYTGINIGGNLTGLVGGAGTSAGALRITQGSDSPEIAALGVPAATAWVSGDGTVISILKNIATGVGSSIPAGTATIGNINTAVNVTPTACDGTVSGSATNAFTASATKHGFTLQNISDVGMWISFTGTAAVGSGNSFLLNSGTIASSIAGGSVFMPVGFNTALSVFGTGDFSCIYW